MDAETAGAIGEVRGLVEGQGKEIGGLRGQFSDMQSTMGGMRTDISAVKQLLNSLVDSGPQPVIRAEQPATEPIAKKRTDRLVAFMNTPGGLLVLCIVLVAALAGLGIAAFSGKSVSELVGMQPHPRSGITLPPPDAPQKAKQ